MKTMSSNELILSIVGAFIATLLASFFSLKILEVEQLPIVLASTGASAILIFAIPHNPASQPWNLVGGYIVCAVIGVTCHQWIPSLLLSSSLVIPISMLGMYLLNCLHPPGAATAVTAVVGGEAIYELGYAFVIVPVFFNMVILLSIAMAVGTLREKNPFED